MFNVLQSLLVCAASLLFLLTARKGACTCILTGNLKSRMLLTKCKGLDSFILSDDLPLLSVDGSLSARQCFEASQAWRQ
jgi:hypothetical protein